MRTTATIEVEFYRHGYEFPWLLNIYRYKHFWYGWTTLFHTRREAEKNARILAKTKGYSLGKSLSHRKGIQ